MIDKDGVFELTFVDDSAPGIFLPTGMVLRGQLSKTAIARFRTVCADLSEPEIEQVLRNAIDRRRRIMGRRTPLVIVTAGDILPLPPSDRTEMSSARSME